jgi:hypothetical protein
MALLWYLSIDSLGGSEVEWNGTLARVQDEDRRKALFYKFVADQKRALGSILLQRCIIRHVFGVNDTDYELARTAEVSICVV